MRRTTVMIVIVGAMFAPPLVAQTTRPTLQTYKNTQYGFQMDYLTNWKPEPGTRPWMVTRFVPASPDDQRVSRVAIGIPQVSTTPIRLDDIVSVMIAEFRLTMPDAKVGVAIDSTLGDEPARRMIITGTTAGPNGTPMRALVIAAVHNGKPYVVGVLAPEDEWTLMRDGFDRLVKSFTFIEPVK